MLTPTDVKIHVDTGELSDAIKTANELIEKIEQVKKLSGELSDMVSLISFKLSFSETPGDF